MNVLFLIPDLNWGGAERQLLELVKGLDKTRFRATLATLYDGGVLRPEAEQIADVRLVSLDQSGKSGVALLRQLRRVAQQTRPQIMLGYMNLASDLCWLIGRGIGAKVVWSLRASNVDYRQYGRGAHLAFQMGAWLSRFADLIIVNSFAGRQYHEACGYSGKHMVVIPNGIDTERFCPDVAARRRARAHWNIADHEAAIGFVGRLDPIKDHPTFLRAVAALAQEGSAARFVCVGSGPEAYMAELRTLSDRLGLGQRVIWSGDQEDMPAVYNGFDLLTSTSHSEGFSNVVGEAMACGVACVVTDVGDSARIVGETGQVVPPRNPAALAEAWRNWLSLSEVVRQSRGLQARARIESEFKVSVMVARTEALLEGLG